MAETNPSDWFVSVHTSASSFIDEGVDAVLDNIQTLAKANTVTVIPHSFNPEIIDRPERHSGHGGRLPHRSAGGYFASPNPEYYKGIALGDARVKEDMFAGFDVMAETIPRARARGLGVHLYIMESASTGGRQRNVAGFPRLLEVDAHGRRAVLPCVNHPDYRAWKLALIEDLYKSYDFDGLLWGVERWGPLHIALSGDTPTCFCAHCGALARNAGLDWARTIEGYRALGLAMNDWRQAGVGSDVPFMSFMRLILKYPELIAWEARWTESYLSLHREIYGTAKWLAPEKPFGLGIWHYYFINPLLHAEWDLADFAASADFLRPILYHLPEGARINHYLDILRDGLFSHRAAQDLWDSFSQVLGLDLPPVSGISTSGLPAEYVAQGVRIVRLASADLRPVYAGIGIDVPEQGLDRDMTADDIYRALAAAASAGADGITISRNYAEMRLESLAAVGDALNQVRQVG